MPGCTGNRVFARIRASVVLLLLVLVHAATGRAACAQVGTTTDILTGRVTGAAGEPLTNATVSATSLQTGIQRSTLTNAQGRYTLIFPDGGGRYELLVAHLGMRAERALVVRRVDAEVLVADVQLAVAPIVLRQIDVLGEGQRAQQEAREAAFDGEWLTLLPIDPSDLGAVASLSPGVVGLEANDSIGSGGFSVLGQRPDLNQIAVDGISFGSPRGEVGGGLGIPAEAVRLTRVITNSFDVSRGQFSGGQIAASTRGGSNRSEGSITYSLFEPRLQWHGDQNAPFNRAYTQHRLSGGYGGPIVRDRAFYFGSAAVQHRSQGLGSLMQADAEALQQLGVHPDSVARFLHHLRQHGLSPHEPVATSRQLIEEVSLFGRLDFVLSDRHSLLLRADGRWNHRDGTSVSALGLPHSGGNNEALGGGVMVGVTSRFRESLINEFRAYLSRQESSAEPYFAVPEGRVRVASEFEDGSRSVSTLVFGGNRSLPVTSAERTLEMSNELSRLIGTRHRLKLGALLHVTRAAQEFSPHRFGSFTFNSLGEFAADQPAAFSRSLTRSTSEGGGLNAAVYLGDTWQASRKLQLTYGARAEASHFARRPEYNPRVDSVFGHRTDHFASDVHVSPRLGFTYLIGADAQGRSPRATVRGGIGEFRGRPPFSLYSTALDATGLPSGQLQIECVGSAVPVPQWTDYRAGVFHIPDVCANGEAVQQSSGSAPNVTVFTPDFSAPRAWRASLGVERPLRRRFNASVEATYNLGTNLYGVSDLNLHAVPRFTLRDEADRPVFVDPGEIIESSGRVSVVSSRAHRGFGQVLQLHSGLRSSAFQFTAEMRGNLPSRFNFRTSYTATWARDQSSFSCCSALQGFGSSTTAGDPNHAGWGRSDFERRHTLRANAGLPIRPWAELTLVGQLTSGAPFTPLVSGDINGDGVRNDRAFLFDPALTADSAVAAGMTRLLAEAPERVRRCLKRQLGGLAERNSCHGPWQSSLELRLNLRPELPGRVGRRLTASIASQNLLTGIDYVVHGPERLRGWGQRSSPDAALLYPRSFDPQRHRFGYEVNERFGDPRQARLPFGSPFQLHVEARVALGPQRR
jgi:hypothetical protein